MPKNPDQFKTRHIPFVQEFLPAEAIEPIVKIAKVSVIPHSEMKAASDAVLPNYKAAFESKPDSLVKQIELV